ncbi:MAG TPA: LysR family transcriptional regulator [Pseudonocardiaceae bacterium]
MTDLSRSALDLERIRKFVVVAEELNFSRAAARLRIAGPSLSQQIKALERDLGVQLFERDRHSVSLTTPGVALLPQARDLLQQADEVRRRAVDLASRPPVRLGYVNWRPPDLLARVAGTAELHVDTWVMPSHTQAARVADHSIDLAICWVTTTDLDQYGMSARLLGADRLYTVVVGDDTSDVRAEDTTVLVDADVAGWASWNVWAEQFARATGATALRIDAGGVTGPAFVDHVRRLRRPVVNSPKGQTSPLPPGLSRRPVVDPSPYWTWSLVWRRDESRAEVLAVVDALTRDVDVPGLADRSAWLPDDDPHRPTGTARGRSGAGSTG